MILTPLEAVGCQVGVDDVEDNIFLTTRPLHGDTGSKTRENQSRQHRDAQRVHDEH